MRAHESAPYCKCDKSFDNGTLCYMVQSDEGNTTFIGCLLNTGIFLENKLHLFNYTDKNFCNYTKITKIYN